MSPSASTIAALSLLLVTPASCHQIPLQASAPAVPLQAGHDHQQQLPRPTRPLEWSTLNILSTTDTHGWLRGHTHKDRIPESLYSASIADVAAFHYHLSKHADQLGVDLLLVDSGDIVDGNGFVDADTSGYKGRAARQILKQVDYDLITMGNHEVRAGYGGELEPL